MRGFAGVRKHAVVIAIVGLTLYAAVATLMAILLNLERQSRQELLDKLSLAKPGIRITEISDQLGPLMRECSDPDEVLHWGTIKDRSFCTGKRLLRYYATTPPCRAVDVYTDANGIIVYAAWTGL